jgi:hypothetical protein
MITLPLGALSLWLVLTTGLIFGSGHHAGAQPLASCAFSPRRGLLDASGRLEPLQVIEQCLGTADCERRDGHPAAALSCALNDITKRDLPIMSARGGDAARLPPCLLTALESGLARSSAPGTA